MSIKEAPTNVQLQGRNVVVNLKEFKKNLYNLDKIPVLDL